MSIKLKVKKGDKVIVIAGKDKGKKGDIMQVFPLESKVKVAGVNLVKRHTKPSNTGSGGVVTKEMPIHVSNILHVDPKTSLPTKVGIKVLENGKKVRFAKKSGEVMDN